MNIEGILEWWRELGCKHEVYIERIERLGPSEVTAFCIHCQKQLFADCGLHLNAKLKQLPKAELDDSKKEGE